MKTLKTMLDTYHAKTIAIIGLAKNTGKTTTLNALLKTIEGKTIALTSIGLDGEAIDQVTYLPKPSIRVSPGMMVATAQETLKETAITYDIIAHTNYTTALGDILIIKVKKPGTLVIAGPSTNADLNGCIALLKSYSDVTIVDGAFNRMTFASIKHLDGLILATGASIHAEMTQTIAYTQSVVESFQLPKTKVIIPSSKHAVILFNDHISFATTKHNLKDMITPLKTHKNLVLQIKGAITKTTIDFFITHHIKGITLIIDDATKLLLNARYFTYLKKLAITVEVLHTIPLMFVTINPFNPNGDPYDKHAFYHGMQEAVPVPVINVQEKE